MATALSVIIPANNEAEHIAACLSALLASRDLPQAGTAQVIVVPNGCTDDTGGIAAGFAARFAARGWQLQVVELAEGNKLAALDAGDDAATCAMRAYLDADVAVSKNLLAQTVQALQSDKPRYVSGQVQLAQAQSGLTRAYGRFYAQVPFMTQTAPGCGYFAMNGAGRARWASWPRIISDDTFARLSFAPDERVQVDASYEWPLVEGFANLIKVRRRQNAGVAEIAQKFPALLANDAKQGFTAFGLLRAIARAPLGFVVYAGVALAVKLSPGKTGDWRRGR